MDVIDHLQSADEIDDLPQMPGSSSTGQSRALKRGDTFGVFTHGGMISPGGADGLYFCDTRHLSRLELLIDGARPVALSSMLSSDSIVLNSDWSNGGDADPCAEDA